MTKQPWKTHNWFVSQWNYADEVRKDFKFAKQIKIHDITLRDGEQQTGIILSKDDKIRIAEALAEAGVHRIEAGMPIVSPSDAEAIKEIARRNLGPQIFAFSRCMKEDVQRAIDTGVNGVVMEIPSSQHMVDLAYKWPMEKAIETSIEATLFAKKNGLEVVFFPIDFSRSEMNWVLSLINRVATEGHMDALALVDTFGVVSPHAMQYFVREVKKRINKRLEAHFHQDFGMGVANTIMAAAEGVEVLHTTVLGVGERAGNTPMDLLLVNLKLMGWIDNDLSRLGAYCRAVSDAVEMPIPVSYPVFGKDAFETGTGVHASAVIKAMKKGDAWLANRVYSGVPSDLFGLSQKIAIGPMSGKSNVEFWLEQRSIAKSDALVDSILAKAKGSRQMLTDEQIMELVKT